MFDEDEEWLDIPGYPDYAVSNFGRVWSIRRNRPLKSFSDKDGYQIVSLFYDGKRRDIKVHRLVAMVFLPSKIMDEVNHSDGDKSYNDVDNLEWMTHDDNMRHAFQMGLCTMRAVRILETGDIYESLTACAKAIGGSVQGVHNCLSGLRRHHHGFTFEYVEMEKTQ